MATSTSPAGHSLDVQSADDDLYVGLSSEFQARTQRVNPLGKHLKLNFTNKYLPLEALLALGCGITKVGPTSTPEGNKRIAMHGDVILKLLIVDRGRTAGDSRRKWQLPLERIDLIWPSHCRQQRPTHCQ